MINNAIHRCLDLFLTHGQWKRDQTYVVPLEDWYKNTVTMQEVLTGAAWAQGCDITKHHRETGSEFFLNALRFPLAPRPRIITVKRACVTANAPQRCQRGWVRCCMKGNIVSDSSTVPLCSGPAADRLTVWLGSTCCPQALTSTSCHASFPHRLKVIKRGFRLRWRSWRTLIPWCFIPIGFSRPFPICPNAVAHH